MSSAGHLDRNNFLYETLLARLRALQRRPGNDLLPFVEQVAKAAFSHHPGRFADGALENIPLRIGRKINHGILPDPGLGAPGAHLARSRTLHVASEVHLTGGHTRVLAAWVQRDLSSNHAIVLTRQPVKVPQFLHDVSKERSCPLILLRPEDSIEARASQIKSLATRFERVILHSHPDDVIPVLAFAQPGGCPVAMFNHAHFSFSFGPTVSDLIINTLPYYQGITRRHRFARHTALLTGPVGSVAGSFQHMIDKPAARAALDLPPDSPVAMTIGHEHYFSPGNGYNFFQTLERLLTRQQKLQFLVVGVREASPLVPAQLRSMKRLRLLGPVGDPTPFYRAADLCLESFPMPSLGALVGSVLHGEAFPVPVYGPGESILRVNILDYEFRPPTEDDYLNYICDLLAKRDEARRKAACIRSGLIERCARFPEQFLSLYQQIDSLKHTPMEIPETKCCVEEDSRALASLGDLDVGLELDRLLPVCPALLAHLRAAVSGYAGKRDSARRIRFALGRLLGDKHSA